MRTGIIVREIRRERESTMVKTRRLSNGIRVVTERMPYFKTAAFGVWVKVGSADETKENNGISHVIEHMLFQGTKTRSAKQLAQDSAAIGDNVNAFTSKEYTSYYGVTLSDYLPAMIEMLGDMIGNSVFDPDALEKEKGVILEEIDMYDDSPEDLVHELLQQQVWRDHPLGFIISGEKEVVKSFTRDEILAFLETHYTAENMVLSVAGHFDEDAVLQNLERAFGGVRRGNGERILRARDALKDVCGYESPYHREYPGRGRGLGAPVYHPCFCSRNKDIEQLHMNMAFDTVPADAPEKYALAVLNSLLGGSNNSRLFQVIREELGLAYSVYSYGSSFEKAGLLQIDVTLNPSQAELAFDRIFEEFEKLKTERVPEKELATHISQVRTELVMGSESPKSRMNGNAKAVLSKEKIESLQYVTEQVASVGAEDLITLANRFFDPARASMCLVGPIGKRMAANWEKKFHKKTAQK